MRRCGIAVTAHAIARLNKCTVTNKHRLAGAALLFVRVLAKRKGQADRVIEFIDPKSDLAKNISKEYWVKEETEKPKLSAKQVIRKVRESGFADFGMYQHTLFWRKHDAKNPAKGFGTMIVKAWYWYQHWPIFIISELERERQTEKPDTVPTGAAQQATPTTAVAVAAPATK